MADAVTLVGVHSPDRLWWWDGTKWVAAMSPDGAFWFDGRAWRPRAAMVRPGRRWYRTVAIVAAVIVGFVGSLVLYGWASSDAHDALSLDDDAIRATATSGCAAITQALRDGAADRQERISSGNEAIQRLIDGMNALGSGMLAADEPAAAWTQDWARLEAARSDFAERLRGDPATSFRIPEVDGDPISERIAEVSPPECSDATRLATSP